MKSLHLVLIPSAALALSAQLPAPPIAASMKACEAPAYPAAAEAPNLQGQWDFLMLVGGTPSPGLMAIGPMDGDYAGSLTPYRTNTVVVRRLRLDGAAVKMSVATREGEVRFEGQLKGTGDIMCGAGLYHGGLQYQLVAVRRPTSYVPR